MSPSAAIRPPRQNCVPKHVARHQQETTIPKASKGASALDKLVDTILKSLDDDKAQDVLAIDLVGKTSIADRMVIASGTSGRMVSAMAQHLVTKLKTDGYTPMTEGEKFGDWVLVDAGDVIVHLFRPEVRSFYNIERIWQAPAAPANAPVKTGLKTGMAALPKKAPAKKPVKKDSYKKESGKKDSAKKAPPRKAARRA